MRESRTSQNIVTLHRSSSLRLRKRHKEVKQKFVKNRLSGDFGYSLSSDAVDNTDNTDDVLTNCKVDTLDPGPAAGGVQHNLRPLLRNMKSPNRREGIKIKHFGMIDQPPDVDIRSFISEKYDKRLVFLIL